MSSLRLEPQVDGNPLGETLFFVQGWPDDASVWDDTVHALADQYRCVRVTLPGMDGQPSPSPAPTTQEIMDALAGVLLEVATTPSGVMRPVTLILHDWGCYWGYMLHHREPALVRAVCGLDVAPHLRPTVGDALLILLYQSWLALAFLLGQISSALGNAMTRAFAGISLVPRPMEKLHSGMNFPYRNVFADMVSGLALGGTRGYWPKCPLLYVYGKRKPFQFQSARWLDHVRQTGGKVIELPTGHWLQKDARFLPILEDWLNAVHASTPTIR